MKIISKNWIESNFCYACCLDFTYDNYLQTILHVTITYIHTIMKLDFNWKKTEMQEKIFYGEMRIKYGFKKKMTLNLNFI